MHILRVESQSLDDAAQAVDLDQTPAEMIGLSFTDADLSILASAWEVDQPTLPTLRLARLTALRHPFSVDLYLEKTASHARFILVRLLGGKDYWSYGVDELAALARARGIHLALVPGDDRKDLRLEQASTLLPQDLRRIWSYFNAGGAENLRACLRFAAGFISKQPAAPPPKNIESFGVYEEAGRKAGASSPLALIVFYRAWLLAADVAPIVSLANALAERGFQVAASYVTSLKDEKAIAPMRALIADKRPDVILNMTGFSAKLENGGSVLDGADAPVIQLALSGGEREQWLKSSRGLGPADLAMNVALPELDGRIAGGAISFKCKASRNDALQFDRVVHAPEHLGVAHAADLAYAWATLRRAPRSSRRLACILSDYPAKGGRTGYALGLDTPGSVVAIAERLSEAGFDVDAIKDSMTLMQSLADGEARMALPLSDYFALFHSLPQPFIDEVYAAWGPAEHDDRVRGGGFEFRFYRAGKMLVAAQPDRGDPASRKVDYHSALLPPRHGYIAFYLWLREVERVHAIIHCGAHGTLEWLPGKAVALSETCGPRAVLGPTPLIYPFIVNNPGEAAQAKRRAGAVTVGHLTPALRVAGGHGAVGELETLFDEYAEAQSLDPRRAARLADLILDKAAETGLAEDAGIATETASMDAMVKLDAWLCDVKDMRIGDGLHVFGRNSELASATSSMISDSKLDEEKITRTLADCGEAEMRGLISALDGRFVPPGPAGAPSRGRTDVLPTGRNLFSMDPRAAPTRTAWEIGRRVADEVMTRHAQDAGRWPQRIVIDLWGSATMRTGGDDLAQALALLGVQPRWDLSSNRVAGFDILPLAALSHPRVDVTLRISGLFRDVFPTQLVLFDQAVRAVSALDEALEDNPLAAQTRALGGDSGPRIFGAAPGQYGIGLSRELQSAAWKDQNELADDYLEATSFAYGATAEGVAAAAQFRDRVKDADAFVHTQDIADQDILSADAFSEHEGGFAAAAALLGGSPILYHADTTRPETPKVRTLREELARVLRARAINPIWLAGQMRHGYRGAAEIAETVDNLFAYAALTDAVRNQHFDLLFDAILGDQTVRSFLFDVNPAAAASIVNKFEEALSRGLWMCQRNSIATILANCKVARQ